MSVATADVISAPEFRAAGTDLSERRRSGLSCGAIIDLGPDTIGVVWNADGSARIGALTTIAAIASDPRLAEAYPGIAAAAQGLATPQIRHMATLGGNLAQRSRCWYFRNPQIACLKKGGADCPARSGNHLYHVTFDLGPCVAPHPSTMAMALLAYDAKVATDRRSGLSISDLLGDGSNGAADNLLASGERIERIELPVPLAGERALYKRAISRTHAEWPLVEICVRAVISGGAFQQVHIAAGGIAPVPLRLAASAAALQDKQISAATIAQAAELATSGARPLPMTGYKLELLTGLVRDVIERIVA
ncbi:MULTISPECIES: FAD binding domain-containing protein [Bradyrhizobium]|jgi:xanthine dehydrogenase YagS FAD-binding subunit|uniref:Xanthine dehydrogenase YagS FAD-binding subunit n=1 Tax=Bradyrhizobium elkanii TaxID=29448 RepID=A0A8I2C2T8_BRAEL|nr:MULTISPECIES: FAD binding domain-containing protein [Bradyrhizobium]MBP1290676.1 xanthine dehydrogenase YagS FAD-binding subunit [Bradyrhizobium elkanii]MCP1929008.1 xanthine dehydrogenase YagS FAD-binding subunit [Bradyrhizobium elkanii]MCS3473670.1 xanthine dehydrogenase YagS FAD-binding subunit [Bradyrhizobium elkanii]MCS3580377.1 xanthine dehydrogenase YagS FAD-binding subunit [Bradyrhizobium elkanii]MCS3723253.1 xanthine dehydrogenase YagS FAD-binding subunit [Bradyrhizobium elkanii]